MKSAALRHPARLAGASLLRMQSDARLAELAVAGHEAAFDAIVDRYRTPLTRYCAGIVGPSRAEDAVQQTLINAHEAMTRTDEVRHLKSWLYRIAHNASLNVLRAVKDDVPLDEAALGARAGAGASDPDESFARSEHFRATLAALQALPERQRAALVLRELEGRSHEEIAEALGVTKGSARQHLMRARVAVRSAVTAITPYPLVARLAELLSGGSGTAWVDAAAGAGASATLMKLGAGVAATGALVGGAVGTQHVIRERPAKATPAARETAVKREPTEKVVRRTSVAAAVAKAPVVVREATARVQGASSSTTSSPKRAKHRGRRHAPHAPAVIPSTTPAAAAAPAARTEATRHGRDRSAPSLGHGDHGHGRGRGSDDRPAKADHGRRAHGDGNGSRGRGVGSQGEKNKGKDKDKVKPEPASSGPTGKGKAEDKGDDAPTPPATNDSASDPGSKGSGPGAKSGSGASDSASATGTASTVAPPTTTPATSTTPAPSSSDDEDD